MTKFLLILICIVSTHSLTVNADTHCTYYPGLEICGEKDVITFIQAWEQSPDVTLDLNHIAEIAPHTFRNVSVASLAFRHLDEGDCIPKIIQLTPDSFAGLSVDRLELNCMEFTVRPNPFKHLESVISLQVMKIRVKGMLREFLADFSSLNDLTLADLNITNVSQDTFSGINENLTILRIFDHISFVGPKAFERFQKLKSLLLNAGQLTELRSHIFGGLAELKYLDLDGNKIAVLRNHTFKELPKLETLSLAINEIYEIESESFSGLNLRELYLHYNNLTELAIGVFDNLKNLEILALSYNKIRALSPNLFTRCVKLRTLNLDFNEISRIGQNVFWGLHVNRLDLSYNKLNVLGHDTFSGLHVDSLLDLRFNHIRGLDPKAFRNLTAGEVSLCWSGMTQDQRVIWDVGDSITRITVDGCSDDDELLVSNQDRLQNDTLGA